MKNPVGLNRVCLLLVGLVLLAAGGYGLARSYGAFGDQRRLQPLLDRSTQVFVATHHHWFWQAAAGVAVVVALLGLAWLRAQLRGPRPANEDFTQATPTSTVTVKGGAAANAVAADLQAGPDIEAVSARVIGDIAAPLVYLRLDLQDNARLASVRDRIDDSLGRLRQALQVERTDTLVEVRLSEARHRTVL